MDKDLALINEKMDQLIFQVAILTDQAESQKRRNQEFDELKADVIPIGNQLINLAINELEEIGTEFELDDLLYLLKRALRNTQLILTMMDRFEALMGIGDEVGLLGKQVFSSVVEFLDRLEQEGLFIQSREFLNSLAQTNILADMNQMVLAYQSSAGQDMKPPTLGSLLREFNQPETKKGLFRILKVLQALGE